MSGRFLFGESIQKVENRLTLPLKEKGLAVGRGWNDEIARQLVERSKEEEMRRFAKRDALERFVDEASANKWFESKGHIVYVLGEKAAVAGIVWFSHTVRPEIGADYTFAIRMYEAQRGQGLSGAFLEAAHEDFRAREHYKGTLWLAVDADNPRARHFYEKHGYTAIGTEGDQILMVRKGAEEL